MTTAPAQTPAPDAARGAPALTAAQLNALRPHVISVQDGRLAATSIARPKALDQFTTTTADIQRIFAEDLPAFIEAQPPGVPVPVMIWAHGGLVSKAAGFATAQRQVAWWKENGVYPIHMVWESGLLTAVQDAIMRRKPIGSRGFTDVTDRVVEVAARIFGGQAVWGDMKLDAAAGSVALGGAQILGQELAKYMTANPDAITLHAAGHSAGSIFHSHFVPAALDAGVTAFDSVSLLAPAVRVDTFEDTLLRRAESGQVRELSIFTMDDEHELKDHTTALYRKSLLYLVSHSFESEREAAILGMQKYLAASGRSMRYLKGDPERLVYSPVSGSPRSSSLATSHGDFDNDAPTMESVARRIATKERITPFPASARVADPIAPSPLPPAPVGGSRSAGGSKRALCIGIDAYPSDPLTGAVADAQAWEAALKDAGFTVETLLDAAATRDEILSGILNIVTSSSEGDVVVIQFAGHGTFVPDLDGDETDEFGPSDEALCPVDFREGRLVLDDDLAPIWDLIPEGVAVSLFFDSCHSGTASRGGGDKPTPMPLPDGSVPRFVPLDDATLAAYRGTRAAPAQQDWQTEARAAVLAVEAGRLANKDGNRPQIARREVQVSACLPNELAYENGGHGVFTRTALDVLVRRPGLSHRGFVDAIVSALGPNRTQTPLLTADTAPADRVLFAPAVEGVPVPLKTAGPTLIGGSRPAAGGDDKRNAAVVAILRATADLLEADAD